MYSCFDISNTDSTNNTDATCVYIDCKHSIASEAFCMNQVTFALQNIKIRLWYFTYVFSRLIEGEKDYEKLLPSAVAR